MKISHYVPSAAVAGMLEHFVTLPTPDIPDALETTKYRAGFQAAIVRALMAEGMPYLTASQWLRLTGIMAASMQLQEHQERALRRVRNQGRGQDGLTASTPVSRSTYMALKERGLIEFDAPGGQEALAHMGDPTVYERDAAWPLFRLTELGAAWLGFADYRRGK